MQDCPCQIKVTTASSDNLINIQILDNSNFTETSTISDDNYRNIHSETEIIVRKGFSPFINSETGTWWEYDDSLQGFINTGISATADLSQIEEELNSLANVAKTGDFSDLKNVHTLKIGNFEYNGTQDIEIPIYDGVLE